MLRPALASVAVAAALTGCAAPTERPGPGMRWAVSASAAEGGKLVLGVPDTDDVRLVMTCRPQSGEIDVTFVGRPGDPAVVELQSGEVVGRYAGAGQADEETVGAIDIQFKARTSDPVFARLADTGDLAVVLPQRRVALPNAFSPAHDFLRICRSPN
jgi:hypothetical protein